MSATRVTHQTIATSALANLQQSMSATSKLSDRLSSGRQIQRPSDNPAGTVTALQIRADSRAQAQYARNADDGLGWLTTTDGALNDAVSSLRRARELVLQGANTGANGPAARQALALEITAIRDGMLETANTSYLGRPVFGGTTAGGTAFDATGTYVGDTGSVQRRMNPTATVRVDTGGVAVFGSGADSVFQALADVAEHLVSDPAKLQDDIGRLAAHFDKVINGLADVGARHNRTESLRQLADDRVLDLRTALSQVENIDLPKTVMDLQLQQVAYQASLGATAKVIQPTLMDFLR